MNQLEGFLILTALPLSLLLTGYWLAAYVPAGALAEVFRRTARVFQAGTQRRSLPGFMFAVELARRGKLGKLKSLHAHPLTTPPQTSGWLKEEPAPPREQLDRQGALLREAQRNLQMTNDKLEALKAIERSLTARPPAAPTSRPRAAAPASSPLPAPAPAPVAPAAPPAVPAPAPAPKAP